MEKSKTTFSKKAQNELKRRKEIKELEFRLYGQKRLKKILA